ncbi:MAG: hypothetical protein M3Z16_03970 [Pseudomonadota bacterium]|nr:hypothetical protein [Pseudomonadota bacterium]
MLKKLTLAAVVAGAAAFSAPALARDIYVDVAPPALRHEVVPAPRAGYIWGPGYWDYRGGRHHWVRGNWVRERRGYVYTHPSWANEGNRWHYNRANWARGDRDHDGVPNRLDRHPDNPHRR